MMMWHEETSEISKPSLRSAESEISKPSLGSAESEISKARLRSAESEQQASSEISRVRSATDTGCAPNTAQARKR